MNEIFFLYFFFRYFIVSVLKCNIMLILYPATVLNLLISSNSWVCVYMESLEFSLYMIMHAKLLQSCPILCNPVDCSLPVSSVHGILQGKIPGWLPCPPPGDLSNLGIQPVSPRSLELGRLSLAPPINCEKSDDFTFSLWFGCLLFLSLAWLLWLDFQHYVE